MDTLSSSEEWQWLREVSHPGRNISDCFTGYNTLIVEEACPRVDLLSIKGQQMASHIQVHASTTGVGVIDSVNGKNQHCRSLHRGWSTCCEDLFPSCARYLFCFLLGYA